MSIIATLVRTRAVVALTSTAMLLTGCATASSGIATAYVSPMQFQSYDCQQVSGEMQRISVRVNQLAGRLDKAAENDKALVGVGVLLFWPALFALGGTKEQEAEYARLRGEYDALQKVGNEKKCSMTAMPAAPALAASGAAT